MIIEISNGHFIIVVILTRSHYARSQSVVKKRRSKVDTSSPKRKSIRYRFFIPSGRPTQIIALEVIRLNKILTFYVSSDYFFCLIPVVYFFHHLWLYLRLNKQTLLSITFALDANSCKLLKGCFLTCEG